ncbi:MAG: hypothetical protein LBJ31_06065 [Treponema sp.]|jgi:hypothetical protein|nr:hypothetical protein [Treponema sp.]
MNANQEIYAKALEIAALMIGKSQWAGKLTRPGDQYHLFNEYEKVAKAVGRQIFNAPDWNTVDS